MLKQCFLVQWPRIHGYPLMIRRMDLDIDIFIKFPLTTSLEDLKAQGLELAQKCIKEANGTYEERYASHPYLTGLLTVTKLILSPVIILNIQAN